MKYSKSDPREIYDQSCYNAVTGLIGRLQTVFTKPVYANETVSINLVGALRLAELHRYLTLDCKVDIFGFFVKHRHVYGSDWTDMFEEGINTTTVLPTETFGCRIEAYGGTPAGAVPKAYPEGYANIWNHYFRIPNVTPVRAAGSIILTGPGTRNSTTDYGAVTALLPAYWNTGIPDANIDADTKQDVEPNLAGNIELLDIARVESEYADEQAHEWFAHRYRDVLKYKHDIKGAIPYDADERPELLMHSEQWLSGYDVDGTDTATLGNYKGKSQGIVQFQIPPRYFNEHGMIWIMMVLRFPSILQEEAHYLMHHTWDYDTIMGDPNVINTKPPHELTEDDFHGQGGTDSWGHHPFAQWARTQPNHVHQDFWGLAGFPFLEEVNVGTDLGDLQYGDATGLNSYEDYFANPDLGHWNLISKAEIETRSNIPAARNSIYAGVHRRQMH